ncbi:MAG: LacI family transcriptional regulator [Candidatus Hydrogenedentota bacterium]
MRAMLKNAEIDPGHSRIPVAWTMEAIARKVGVSTKTVSRVVNGEPGVRESTRTRVSQFIEQVGYHPHIGARSMRSHTRDCIGCTIPAPMTDVPVHEEFFIRLFSHLYRLFGSRGRYICFDLNPYYGKSLGDYARGLFEGRFAGCILCGPLRPDDTTIARIHASGMPYLALGRSDTVPECSCATVDYELAMKQSVEVLASRGHTRIGVLKGFHGYQPGAERRRGYLQGHEAAGIEPDLDLLRKVSFTPDHLVATVRTLLADPTVTAFIDSSGSENAAGIREGCRLAGRVPGQDVEIVAWTYSHGAAYLLEATHHVWLPVWEAATEGLEQMSRWFDGEAEGPIRIVREPTVAETSALSKLAPPIRLFDIGE